MYVCVSMNTNISHLFVSHAFTVELYAIIVKQILWDSIVENDFITKILQLQSVHTRMHARTHRFHAAILRFHCKCTTRHPTYESRPSSHCVCAYLFALQTGYARHRFALARIASHSVGACRQRNTHHILIWVILMYVITTIQIQCFTHTCLFWILLSKHRCIIQILHGKYLRTHTFTHARTCI